MDKLKIAEIVLLAASMLIATAKSIIQFIDYISKSKTKTAKYN